MAAFEDRAGYHGEWDLSTGVASVLARHIARDDAIETIDRERVQEAERDKGVHRLMGVERVARIGQLVGADYVVTGTITAFGVRRVVVGDPNLAGYKSYSYRVELEDVEVTRVGDRSIVESFDVAKDSTSRPLEVNLFGRPGQEEAEFKALFKVGFDSEEYRALTFGRFADASLRDTGRRVVDALIGRPAIDLSREDAMVLAVEGQEVYLGVGSDDRVEFGDVLPLLSGEDRVGVVKVAQIISPHMCKATMIEQRAPIVRGTRIGQRLKPGGDLEDGLPGAGTTGTEDNR